MTVCLVRFHFGAESLSPGGCFNVGVSAQSTRQSVLMQRTVLLTGASRGIGRSIAERLLNDGHRLSLGLRTPDALLGLSLIHI